MGDKEDGPGKEDPVAGGHAEAVLSSSIVAGGHENQWASLAETGLPPPLVRLSAGSDVLSLNVGFLGPRV